jgi:hypothetical protein
MAAREATFCAVRRLVAALAVVGAVALIVPAGASARATVGMGDQKLAMFSDARFSWLGIKHARLVVAWDVMRHRREVTWARAWLEAARAQGVEPFVAFGHAWSKKRDHLLPSRRLYARSVRAFRRAFPWVRAYTPWNEANHCSQPTCHRPRRAAAYWDVLRSQCKGCTVVAADVLDQESMPEWVRVFRRAARHKPRIWGLHNYVDANRLRSRGTRRFLRVVRGRVWITETGGVVRRNRYRGQIDYPESAPHAGRVTRHVLRLADRLSHRIDRIYLYQWNADSLVQNWDSGLIGPFGEARPGFAMLARHRGLDPAQAPPATGPPPASDPSPPGPAGPGAEQQPPPEPEPAPPPAEPEEPCLVPLLCELD